MKPLPQLSDTLAPLVVELNRTVEAHFTPGNVDFVEVIRACMSLATAYQRALEGHSPNHANMIRENAIAIAEWMTAHPH